MSEAMADAIAGLSDKIDRLVREVAEIGPVLIYVKEEQNRQRSTIEAVAANQNGCVARLGHTDLANRIGAVEHRKDNKDSKKQPKGLSIQMGPNTVGAIIKTLLMYLSAGAAGGGMMKLFMGQ